MVWFSRAPSSKIARAESDTGVNVDVARISKQYEKNINNSISNQYTLPKLQQLNMNEIHDTV